MSFFRALPFVLCLAAPATAQEAFTWVYNAHYPFAGTMPELNLVAADDFSAGQAPGGVPRGLVWARCVDDALGGNVVIRFEAFAGAAQAGDAVAFQMSDDAGTVLTHSAVIVNAGDDPVGGPEILVSADGPEMAMLANTPVVRYGLVGLTDFNIAFDFSGNQAYVAQFASDCAATTSGPGGGLDTAAAAPPADPPSNAPPAFVPDVGPDLSGHVWSRLTQVDETDIFGTLIQAFYSVPESDDVLIYGECEIGAQGPYVALEVTADVAGLANGDLAVLRASIPDGRSVEIEGTVIGVGAEFGVVGIELALDMTDPAWLVLAGDEVVRLERDGGQALTITGNGPNTIGPFLADCAEIARLTPESGGRPSTPIDAQPGYLACDNFGRVSSRETGVAQVVNFINSSDGFRSLAWIDPAGAVVDVTALNPGQAAAFTTDPGHIWMATDGPGNCMEMMQVPAGVTDYRITAVSQ